MHHDRVNSPLIEAECLTKTYRVRRSKPGLVGALRGLVSGADQTVVAVEDVSFAIGPGETVGYIGKNGAGKSTTIKMLTGILVPTSGSVTVAGIEPSRNRTENGKRIGVAFGQRTSLNWDIPVRESFRLLREIYRIPVDAFERNVQMFNEVLGIEPLLGTPVRKLSLGQRMKCDLAAAFLHDPEIAYLDEPTIGLDVVAKDAVRAFINHVNHERGTTVILATHDLQDIEKICNRAMIIDAGHLVYDGPLEQIFDRHALHKEIRFDLRSEPSPQSVDTITQMPGVEPLEVDGHLVLLAVDPAQSATSDVARAGLDLLDVADLSLSDPGIESVVKSIYEEKLS